MALWGSVRASSTRDAEESPHWVVLDVSFSIVTATGRCPGQSASCPVSGSVGAAEEAVSAAGTQPVNSAAQSARHKAVRFQNFILFLFCPAARGWSY